MLGNDFSKSLSAEPFAHNLIGCTTVDIDQQTIILANGKKIITGLSTFRVGVGNIDFCAGRRSSLHLPVFFMNSFGVSVNTDIGNKPVRSVNE